ncbi:hypothetical protein GCM10010193_25200 [Kitasatospora atroaurantiaca]|uniref:MYXO-CTERM domain-containing protein n=1 Tax=Kitasatospora atroaurantiaca TaxID=285545 RepID=A0A561F0L9_9ACTN|nr:hypothetical protein [Kitasatospora atroaurantiaca]TWE21409.1 hypothetical protein FB465_6592 [Kitasatospora atroaurantiaca]
MQTIRRPHRAAARAAAIAAAALAVLCGTAPAQAAGGDDIPDYKSAQQVLRTGQLRDTVSRFLVAAPHAGTPAAAAADGGTVGAPGNAPAAPPRFDLKDPVPMFELSPEFVSGKVQPTAQNAVRLSYLASRVSAADGHQAAVLLAPQAAPQASNGQNGTAQNVAQQGWQLAGIRDGDAEVSLAERGTPQARTFTEPQIHAWYRITEQGTVEPLNQEATTSLGGKRSVTLAAYQKLVASRYGDKLPGSAYDRKGLAGGFGLAEDKPVQEAGRSWQPAVGTGAAALAAVAGAAAYRARRRSAATR